MFGLGSLVTYIMNMKGQIVWSMKAYC